MKKQKKNPDDWCNLNVKMLVGERDRIKAIAAEFGCTVTELARAVLPNFAGRELPGKTRVIKDDDEARA